LQRAVARPDVLDLMKIADQALSLGDLSGAQAAFQQALVLDDSYEPAATGLQSVNEQLTELAFRDAMSRALAALEAEQVGEAEAALKLAASLKPGDEAVRNTQQQLAQTRQRLWLAGQREKALGEARNENWSAAVATYRAVLARVPQAGFAEQGLAFAQDRAKLHGQFDHYLDRPERLFADEPRLNAEELLAAAGTASAAEPRLADKISHLRSLVVEARTPLNITLKSDGLTEVVIYHIGRLGQFTSQQLELLPGTYTIVGSRAGYRDVRRTVTLKPGPTQPTLDIRCEEPI
jgi:tetratricopeptide (TPR) repeat protein